MSDNAARPVLVEIIIITLTHHSTYILTVPKRDEMIRDGRAREMYEVVRTACHAEEDVIHAPTTIRPNHDAQSIVRLPEPAAETLPSEWRSPSSRSLSRD